MGPRLKKMPPSAAGLRPPESAFARDVEAGLSGRPKRIPSKYLYDAEGSRLFQAITDLEEYYLSRAELDVLLRHKQDLASMLGAGLSVIELGCGDGKKTRILLEHFADEGLLCDYVPIDVSEEALEELSATLYDLSDRIDIRAVAGDYLERLSSLLDGRKGRWLALFLGSNIGNFSADESRTFLKRLRKALHAGDHLLIGFDLRKDIALIERAYDDRRGVTRDFNLNLLARMNRELGADFDTSRFVFRSYYHVGEGRVESWLVSTERQRVRIEALDREFAFEEWEGIGTEVSRKYTVREIEELAAASGFLVQAMFFDRNRHFVDALWRAGTRGGV